MKMWKRNTSAAAAAAVLAVAMLGGCAQKPQAAAPSAAAAEAVLQTAVVGKQTVGDSIEQVAEVAASLQLDIVSKASGTVLEKLKRKGDTVQQGDVLFTVDTTDLLSDKRKTEINLQSLRDSLAKTKLDTQTNRLQLENNVTRSRNQLKTQQEELNKLRNEYDAGIASKRQVEQAEQQLEQIRRDTELAEKQLAALDASDPLASIQSQIASTEVSLQDLNRHLADYEVKAPASGVLNDLTVEAGATVSQGIRVGQIVQMNPAKITTEVAEPLLKLVEGKPEIAFYTGTDNKTLYKAKVTFVGQTVNAQSKAYAVELEADNADGKLKQGMRVQLVLSGAEEQKALAVPTSAIVKEGPDNFVYVVEGDKAVKRPVKLGRWKDLYQEVLEGVKEGDKVITTGLAQLKDGQTVKTQ
ncbi:efflux RND transporter periplasmic adaptor subunit [Paenibacillus chartarius]|uniref:Efflux RND transporter periplasmic adaptor subunit n=1 Tax=Paenibacillus chartarius TaxID=747481 RepID=A0ABV6DR34_9BACL